MPDLKEPRFFGYEGEGERLKFPIRTLEEYTALFDAVTDEIAIGEATPHYLVYPHAAQRIHDLIPQARLIASLRDPVERSYSVYQMNLRNRGVNDGVPFVEAIRTDRNLRETYGDMLARYFALFPPEQLKVILLEDLEKAPQATMRGLYGFLGVDPELRAGGSAEGRQSRRRAAQQAAARPFVRPAAPAVQPGVPARRAVERLRGLRSRNLEKQPLKRRRTAAPRSASSATTSCAPRI